MSSRRPWNGGTVSTPRRRRNAHHLQGADSRGWVSRSAHGRLTANSRDVARLSPLPWHTHLIRADEGPPHRLVRLDQYDQANVVYRRAQMTGDQLRLGRTAAYEQFYSVPSM